MLYANMKDVCRICARELCGNQRRWIFHSASKLNLQVLLSHVLGKEVLRDGRAEFACSKCAFMLDRIYRFDTVIARIEALSIERLQKLLSEKDRLKLCVASLYRKNNEDPSVDSKGGEGTVDISDLPDSRYAALLQEDFTYSGFEAWTEHEDQIAESNHCQPSDVSVNRPKRCHCCAVLRVPDADYEAICKVPRKVARSISCVPSTRYSASMLNEELQEPLLSDVQLDKMLIERESLERISSGSSVESLHTALETSPLHKDDEPVKGARQDSKCDFCTDGSSVQSCTPHSSTLDMALTLVKAFDYRPVQSHKGSRIPVKSSPPGAKSTSLTTDGRVQPNLLTAGIGFMNRIGHPLPKMAHDFIPELADLQELWEDVYEDYMPLRLQNLIEKKHVGAEQCVLEPKTAELQGGALQDRLHEMEDTNKVLQEKLLQMSSKFTAAHEESQKNNFIIRSLNETLLSKTHEAEDLNTIIEEQNASIIKLQEMLHQIQVQRLQVPGSPPRTQPEVDLLNLQNSLFCTQLEMQKAQRAVRQKERQLTDARRAQQMLEAELRDAQQQKESTWTHNQDLHVTLHQLQTQLQETTQQLQTVEAQKDSMIQEKELIIQRRNETLLHKEQLLQEHIYLLQFQEASEKGPGFHDSMLEKLQERIRDRDKALERAVDEKYCAVEERESKLRQVQLAIREKEHDLERLRSVLSSNEGTINSLDSMLKSKDIEIEQISTAYSNLQWLKQQMEEKYSRSIKDREGCIQQLQASLHDRHKELESLSAEWLRKSTGENNEIVEKLQLCLQSKEKMLQDVLSDRNQQATEHEKEIQELLKTVSTRDYPTEQIASEKIAQTERGGDSKCNPDEFSQKDTRMVGFPEMNNPPSLNQQDELTRLRALLEEKEDIIADLMENGSDHSKMMVIVKNNDWKSQESNRDLQIALEKELANAKEEFQIASRKEREARLELSTVQSLVAKQNEDLQVQAADVESLSRSVQIKEELIKDLQVQLVNPEDVPAVESLTQEVLKLREKVAMMELHGQEGFGNRSQELILMLERLVAERARLNDALQSERQLYSNLVNYHSQTKSCEETKTLHLELEAVRVLRGHLEEALGQSLQQLSSLEAENRAPIDFGGQDAGDDGDDDASSEFTDSIEEDADMKETLYLEGNQQSPTHHCHQNPGSAKEVSAGSQKSLCNVSNLHYKEPPGAARDLQRSIQVEEEEKKPKNEFKASETQVEAAEALPVSYFRNVSQSMQLEGEALKEPMEEEMSGWWANEMEKVKEEGGLSEEGLRSEIRRLQGKMRYADTIIHLLKKQLVMNSKAGEMKFNPELIVSMAKEIERLKAEKGSAPMKRSALGVQLREEAAKRHCSRPQSLDLELLLHYPGAKEEPASPCFISQMDDSSQQSFWQEIESSLREQAERLRSELANNREENRELQDKLVVSEATVSAQADQLKQYRSLLSEPSIGQDSKEVQVGIQDLGYETCGRSENEADREETTSPECDEQEDIFSEASMVEELNAQLKLWGAAITSTPQSTPTKFKPRMEKEPLEGGKMEDATVLLQHVKDLKKQLERSERVIWSLKRNQRSLSTSSDCVGSMETLHGATQSIPCEGSPSLSVTDEDEGWQSEGLRTICHAGVQSNKDLHQLTERVSSLEAKLKTSRQGLDPPDKLKSVTWPGKYDSLIQAQARELSLLRLKLREGKGVCHILAQQLDDTVKSFEELLRVNDIDYYMGQSFREQLSQGSQLAERLDSQLNSKDRFDTDDKSGHELLSLRLRKELQQKDKIIEALQSKLHEHSLTPSSSRAISETDPSERASFVSDDQVSTNDDLEACSDVDAASEYTQYHESRTRNQACGTSGQHFNPAACSVGAARAPLPSHSSFINSKPHPPLLGHGCSGTARFSLAEVQQELQTLQKQLGESTPLTTPAVKPVHMPGNFFDTSNSSSSFQYGPSCSLHIPLGQSVLNSSAAGLSGTAGSGFLDSSALWDMSHLTRPPASNIYGDASSGSSGYRSAPKITGNDLLEEHLTEIRNLRQRLEESICTNDRLREQLEERLKSSTKENGSPTNIYIQGLESTPQLSNENRVLRDENLSLQIQLNQLSREHYKELERLRETLLSSRSRLKNAEAELEQQRAESKKLHESAKEKQQEIQQLQEERRSNQESQTRLQHKVTIFEQQLSESQQLLQSVQSELQVYERLYGTSKLVLSAYSGETYQSLPANFDFKELLSEVKTLRVQLEHSIQVNRSLRHHLEQQLEGNPGKSRPRPSAISIFAFPGDPECKRQLFQDAIPSPPVRDVGMHSQAPFFSACTFPSTALNAPAHDIPLLGREQDKCCQDNPVENSSSILEGDAPDGSFANKNGRHVIGHIDDYGALKQQVLEGKVLIHKMESLMQSSLNIPFLEIHGTKALDYGNIRQLFSSTSTLHKILEESAALLTMFWRAALPSTQSICQQKREDHLKKEEILKLQSRLSEQESILQNTMERLRSTSQMKDSMEKFIVGQLTRTHDVLKKARSNLEPLQKNNYKISSGKTHSSSAKGDLQQRTPKLFGHLTPSSQEPFRKKSNLKILKRKDEWVNIRTPIY
ncbi:myomegalin isoform X4 [Ambystoma mexicanum]|uniref:myomegalin isoform X4 n=1 Tax=Ambystoma mexicanum TaxID=8296 RepID=UPI0037E89E55